MNSKQRRKFTREFFADLHALTTTEQEKTIVDLMEEVARLSKQNDRLNELLMAKEQP